MHLEWRLGFGPLSPSGCCEWPDVSVWCGCKVWHKLRFFPACLSSLRHGRQQNSECQMHFLLSVGLLRIQILDSALIVVPSRCHRTELRRRHDGRQPSRFLHNVFVWRKMSDDIDHSKQKRSPHDGTRLPHDGLTMGQIGIRFQHELLFLNTIGNFFLTCQRFLDRSRCCWRSLTN